MSSVLHSPLLGGGGTVRVLVADDDPSHREFVRRLLQRLEGMVVVEAASGHEVLAQVAAHPPDVVLLDLHMPDQHGSEVLAQLRRSDDLRHIPVVIVTEDPNDEAMWNSLALGAEDIIGKEEISTRSLRRVILNATTRATLRRAADDAARHMRRLQQITALLSAAPGRAEVLGVLATQGPILLGAQAGALWHLDEHRLRLEECFGVEPEVALSLRGTPRSSPRLLLEARQVQEPQWLSRDSIRRQFPSLLGPLRHEGVEAWALLPLHHEGPGGGVLCLGFRRPDELSDEGRLFLLGFAEVLGQALERARLYEREMAQVATERRFSGLVSHDLRTPLSAIVTGAALLETSSDPTASAVSLRILSSARRMQRLVEDLLDLSRTRLDGGMPLQRRPVDLVKLVAEVAEEVRAAFAGRPIATDTPVALSARCDPDRVAQVLGNLMRNAILHGDATAPIEVRLGADDDWVWFTVSNQGKPIPDDALPHLFNPFFRGADVPGRSDRPPSPTTSHRAGLGLGLYIARHIAQAHGGFIAVTSSIEAGTSFRVTLPRQPPPSSLDPGR
ncbi:MAG: hybrid sensor histidine kinase/response regulator [Myxococcales bacterium]|nr:MAG: hybrid sensor histidine kinase/response regulator [Myxococcales bacterium]